MLSLKKGRQKFMQYYAVKLHLQTERQVSFGNIQRELKKNTFKLNGEISENLNA
jgi:hypothetical protein